MVTWSTPAWAAGVDQVTISGEGLVEPLVFDASTEPRLTAALHNEVSWLTGRKGDAREPDEDALGAGYVIEIHIDGEARHRYQLYPVAEGGPRVYRPKEQPGDRRTTAGWFYGRLSMPETLSTAGVPLPGTQVRPPGGEGGGGPDVTTPPGQSTRLLDTWREGMQLTGLVAVAIMVGLAAVALLIRRRA
jgi:hypothetical protein